MNWSQKQRNLHNDGYLPCAGDHLDQQAAETGCKKCGKTRTYRAFIAYTDDCGFSHRGFAVCETCDTAEEV